MTHSSSRRAAFAALAACLFAAAGAPARKAWLSEKDVKYYVDPNSNASRQAAAWKQSRPADAALMEELAKVPLAAWLGGGDVQWAVKARLEKCRELKTLPIFVIYNIPNRDANPAFKESKAAEDAYRQWIGQFAEAVGKEPAAVIYEPDALGNIERIPEAKQPARYALMAKAVETLAKSGSIDVYIDVGHAAWLAPGEAAARLHRAGIAKARGFALNVSNFQWTADSQRYGHEISPLVGGKHFVIDTGRNGNGPLPWNENKDGLGQYNPPGRAVGPRPTPKTGDPLCDAFLWIKPPGESDAAIHGGPPSGQWWPEYALGLMKRGKRK